MSQHIVQINFVVAGSLREYKRATADVAERFTRIPGLVWKIWLLDEERMEAGGIYLFTDKTSAFDYIDSDICTRIKTNPLFSQVSIKQFDTIEPAGTITNAPVERQ